MQKINQQRSFNRDYAKFKDKINPTQAYVETLRSQVITDNQIKMKILADCHEILEKVVKDAEKIKPRWN
jgi:hypothetical protein